MKFPVQPRRHARFYAGTLPGGQATSQSARRRHREASKNGGDIQATTKVADCRSLQSSPPKTSKFCFVRRPLPRQEKVASEPL